MKNSAPEPLDGEVNPNHPMTQLARSQWHKICALLMQKMGMTTHISRWLSRSISALVPVASLRTVGR